MRVAPKKFASASAPPYCRPPPKMRVNRQCQGENSAALPPGLAYGLLGPTYRLESSSRTADSLARSRRALPRPAKPPEYLQAKLQLVFFYSSRGTGSAGASLLGLLYGIFRNWIHYLKLFFKI